MNLIFLADNANNIYEKSKLSIKNLYKKLAIYDMFGVDASNDIQTVGYYLYREAIKADSGLGKYGKYPYLSTLGVIFTLVVTPISFLVKHLLEKYGPSPK